MSLDKLTYSPFAISYEDITMTTSPAYSIVKTSNMWDINTNRF